MEGDVKHRVNPARTVHDVIEPGIRVRYTPALHGLKTSRGTVVRRGVLPRCWVVQFDNEQLQRTVRASALELLG
jgi:hypothetical protein